jgi:ATP-dependent helicase IRC3
MAEQMLALRPYQRAAVDAAFAAWAAGMRRPAEVFPTGAGKTVIFAHLAVEWLARNPGRRVLALAHTTELVDQAIAKLHSVAPRLPVGRVQANVNQTLAKIVVASVPTLRSESRRRMIRNVGLVIVDEAHHAVAQTYRMILEHFGALGPQREGGADAIGFTATMERGDDLALGEIWQDVVASMSIGDAIRDGILVRPRGIHVQVEDLDLSQVRTSRGDYREGDLGEALESSMAPEAIAKAITEHADDRKILLFAPTVSSARVIGEALSDDGRSVGLIHGELGTGERKSVLDDYRAGRTQILSNCQVLTEGFDWPAADCAVLARPTKSPVLYKQIAGRVLRPYPGKTDALLLDVVGASKMHSLVSGIELFGEGELKQPKKKTKKEDLEDVELDLELDGGQQDARHALGFTGPLIATEVDLFAGSPMQWLRTRAGVFFLAAGARYIAILPAAPQSQDQWMEHFAGRPLLLGYDVWSINKEGTGLGRLIVQGVEDLSYAMAWADAEVTPAERSIAARDRGWRARPPSQKMLEFARNLRLNVPQFARSGEVSNMITLALASNRIDRYLPSWATGRRG